MHSSGSRTVPVKLTLVGMAVIMLLLSSLVESVTEVFYRVGEKQTRGSRVLQVPIVVATRALCAGACAADIQKRTAIKLEFSCPTCIPAPPTGGSFWPHRCDPNDFIVGIASLTAFPDLDYMICTQVPGMSLTLSIGYTAINDARS
ncbi:uncharacterized protein [Macrobrachium rosenbergii]|uniref:uncharacterized protein n=1 Tax=Macrobrachium rosenbergii TaxID=79674 RepID=UPI0034D39317